MTKPSRKLSMLFQYKLSRFLLALNLLRNHTCVQSFITSSRTGLLNKFSHRFVFYRRSGKWQMSSSGSFQDVVSNACSKSLGRQVKLEPSSGGGYSGGGGAQTSAAVDSYTGEKFFIKMAPVSSGGGRMLRAEYLGVKEMANSNTIKVPRPVAYGEGGPMNSAFVVFEYLNFVGGQGSQRELGRQLALMHKCLSPNGQFGFHVDNTIGATPQPNLPWVASWADFWDKYRLGHMLSLTDNAGLSIDEAEKLRIKTRALISHNPPPSLLHGDLWGGNKGFAKTNDGTIVPVIYDPATYYGDRETDLAMTSLFGGFSSDFYQGYEEEWPLPDGLNHYVLFGGGYMMQSRGMIQQIMRM